MEGEEEVKEAELKTNHNSHAQLSHKSQCTGVALIRSSLTLQLCRQLSCEVRENGEVEDPQVLALSTHPIGGRGQPPPRAGIATGRKVFQDQERKSYAHMYMYVYMYMCPQGLQLPATNSQPLMLRNT